MFFPWSATEDRDESWYESKKDSMLSWQLAQEYPTTPEEAFIKSGNPVFDLDKLEAMATVVEPGVMGYMREISKRVVEFREDAHSLA
jgi:hypothetical protein